MVGPPWSAGALLRMAGTLTAGRMTVAPGVKPQYLDEVDFDPEAFAAVVAADTHTEGMYVLASSWAGFLQANSEDWGAIADLPKVQALLERVVAIDPAVARAVDAVAALPSDLSRGVTLSVGVGKEWLDRRRGGAFSGRDLAWDAAGAGAATLVLVRTRR